MSDDDPGAQRGHRDTRTAQQLFYPAPAAQVRRQVIGIVSKSPEIDDALQSSRSGGLRERPCRISVLALEVGGVQRVHQVVRRLTSRESLLQCLWIVDVAIDGCTAALIGLWASRHGLYLMASFNQSRAQPPPDEAR